jgi:hypothetical protein
VLIAWVCGAWLLANYLFAALLFYKSARRGNAAEPILIALTWPWRLIFSMESGESTR